MNQHSDLFMLAGIAGILRWLEELTILISGPFLTVGLGISLIDLLTGGTLLQTTPWLAFVWAASQAVGIEGQLTGAAFSIRHAWRARNVFAVAGYVLLTLALGYVAFLAAQAFTLHESQGYGVSAALSLIGIDSVSWAFQRAIIAVTLVILSALLRYTAPKAKASDEAQKLRDEIELAPLRAQANAAKVLGARTVVQAALKGVAAPPSQPMIAQGFTQENGASADEDASPEQDGARGAYMTVVDSASGPYLTIVDGSAKRPVRTRKPKRAPRGSLSWEQAARGAWEVGMSIDQLAAAVPGMGRTAAAHWRGVIKAEERERQKQQLREA